MSEKNVFVVARIRNADTNLCVKSKDPKDVARYIDDKCLYHKLLGVNTIEGFKTVIVGAESKEEETHMCILIGATVPEEYVVDYSKIVKCFDNILCPIHKGMFWSHNASYIIIDESVANNHSQVTWWSEIIKEMDHSYLIEIW